MENCEKVEDPVERLPLEVSTHILSFLDAASLGLACQVCRYLCHHERFYTQAVLTKS